MMVMGGWGGWGVGGGWVLLHKQHLHLSCCAWYCKVPQYLTVLKPRGHIQSGHENLGRSTKGLDLFVCLQKGQLLEREGVAACSQVHVLCTCGRASSDM
jgi:hypothetical protein